MDVIHERCCGLDVQKRTVVACLLTPGQRGRPRKEVRTFGTMTADVLALAEWLAVAGRKTDVQDAEWLADLLRHGLLTASYVPDRDQRELRELTRYRTALLRERAAEANRLQQTLEGANLKLAAVATDITGKSGRA